MSYVPRLSNWRVKDFKKKHLMVFFSTSVLWSVFARVVVTKVLSKLNSQHQLKFNLRVGAFKWLQMKDNLFAGCKVFLVWNCLGWYRCAIVLSV